jgi:hypothetical protein
MTMREFAVSASFAKCIEDIEAASDKVKGVRAQNASRPAFGARRHGRGAVAWVVLVAADAEDAIVQRYKEQNQMPQLTPDMFFTSSRLFPVSPPAKPK